MKKRVQKLQEIKATGKMGMVEGVFVTPAVAERLLNTISHVALATQNLRTLCKRLA